MQINTLKVRRNHEQLIDNVGPYGLVAETFVDNGYAPIPIMEGEKRPAISGWQSRDLAYFQSENNMVQHWGRDASHGVGVRLGDGLLAVDVDTDNYDVIAAFKSVLDGYEGEIVRRVGKKGFAQFVRTPEGVTLPNKIYLDGAAICDLLGDGRQCVVPPSIHPDTGRPYTYISDRTLEDCHFDELPIIDDGFMDALTSALSGLGEVSFQATSTTHQHTSQGPVGRDGSATTLYGWINEKAMDNFSAWVPQLDGLDRLISRGSGYAGVALWRNSGTGQPTEKRKRNLSIAQLGIKDFGTDETFSAIDLVMHSEGLDADAAADWLWDRVGEKVEAFLFPEHREIITHRIPLTNLRAEFSLAMRG
ncbi:MAG: bifunctional DNA primase/polymerase [Hyphomicrobiales bacterium]